MKINNSINHQSKNNVSPFVLNGYVEVSNISPCLDSLFLSSKNLISIYYLDKECGLNINFKKWLSVIEKQEKLELINEAIKVFADFVKHECYFYERYDMLHLTFWKAKTKEEHLALIDNHLKDLKKKGEQRIRNFSEQRYKGGWALIDGSLVSIDGEISVIIPQDVTSKIFKAISDHVNEHLDNAEKELDEILSNIEGFRNFYNIEETKRFLTDVVNELFTLEHDYDNESYDLNKIERLVEEYLLLKKVKVW